MNEVSETSLCIHRMAQRRLIYNGVPVCTTKQLAEVYGTSENNIVQNFKRNYGRFDAEKHYFLLTGTELRKFKNEVTDSHLVAPRQRELYLWTERGANRHCKILDTDRAWEQFDNLEEIYFRVKEGGILLPGRNPAALIEAHEEFDSRIMEFFQFLQETLEGGEYVLLPRYCDGAPTVPWENILGLHDNLFYYLRTREVDRLFRQAFPDIKPRWIWNSLMTAGLIAGPGPGKASHGQKSISIVYKKKHMNTMRLIRYKMPVELPTRGRNNIIMVDRRGMTEEEYLSYTQPEEFWIEDD